MHDEDEDDGPWIAGATFGIPRWFIVVVGTLFLLSWLVPGPTDRDVDPGTVAACQEWVSVLNALAGDQQSDEEIGLRLQGIETQAQASESAEIQAAAVAAHESFDDGDVEGFETASRAFTQACEEALAGSG